MPVFEPIVRDFRHGCRSLLRAPGFTASAVLTLALGVGAATTIFSAIDAVLLRPLPYADPARGVMLWSRWTDFDKTWVSDAEVIDYRTRCQSLAGVAAWGIGQANLTGGHEPVRVGVAQVTANVFDVLGARAAVGRTFASEEDQKGRDQVVVISEGLWRREYGADEAIIGKTLLLDGHPRTIVGVMAPGFQLPTDFTEDAAEPTQAWIPTTLDVSERGSHGLYAAGRLRPGATVERVNAELLAITANNTRAGLYPAAMRFTAFAVPLDREILGVARPALWVLAGAVGLLLLIACANVANLLLVRAESRTRELALRAALGGGTAQMLRYLVVENIVLAACGTAAGLLLAAGATSLLASARIDALPRLASVALNVRALAFAAVVTAATALLFGLAPGLRALRVNLADSLRSGMRAGTGGGRRTARGALVIAEIALAVMLVIGAGLMLRSLSALYRVPLGINPAGVLTVRLSLPDVGYERPEKVVLFYQQLLQRVRALPAVEHAGVVRSLPLAATIGDWGLDVDGYAESPGNRAKGDWQVASDGASEALGERLLRGRVFNGTDTSDSLAVAVVNETMARKYWAGREPVGGRIRMGSDPKRPWLTVVGVVGDVRHNGLTGVVKEKFYVPHAQFHRSVGRTIAGMTLVAKTSADPMALVAPIRAAVRSLDPTVPLAAVRPMTDVVAGSIATQHFTGALLTAFGAIALFLAAVGIYGVLAYVVTLRHHEIGVRMAIGAARRDVLWLVLGRGIRLSIAGAAAGMAGAAALTRLMASLLYGVTATDALTFAAVPGILIAVALAASVVPAHRASRVDPLTALRAE